MQGPADLTLAEKHHMCDASVVSYIEVSEMPRYTLHEVAVEDELASACIASPIAQNLGSD
jgi:hypothetical protein